MQQTLHDVGVPVVDGADGFVAGGAVRRAHERAAVNVGDAFDQIGLNSVAAVGKNAVGARHFPGRGGAGTERGRKLRRRTGGGEAEFTDVILCVACADRLHDAD